MPRQKRIDEGLLMEEDTAKIRKRGSPSSSASSMIQSYRFKKAVLVGKRGGGSSTPVPTWRIVASRSPSISLRIAASAETPRSQSGRSMAAQILQPVSARKLAATLWELNEVPVPVPAPAPDEGHRRRRERMGKTVDSLPGSLPRHLSDPSHSPVSEISDRSGTGTQRRRQSSSISRRLSNNAHDVGALDSVSNASFMEIESRSRCQSRTPAGSTAGVRTRLKDVSNALTTSKELLKIISRLWGQEDHQPSSSMSLISALHAELERARLQVNQLIQDQRSDQNEISCLLKCFAEEKATWKNNEKETIQAAVESIAGELEVERKLRRRIESLNKKLGKELAETKALFTSAVKELENEKKARGIIEKEREMLQIADVSREERAKMKLSEAKHQFEEKNAAVDQLRDELEAFLKDKRGKEKAHHASINHGSFWFNQEEEKGKDDREVEDVVKYGDDSPESDLHSIELNINRISKGHKSDLASLLRSSKKLLTNEEPIGRGQRRSTSLLRSVSNVVECGGFGESLQASEDGGSGLGYERFHEFGKQAHRRSCGDDLQRHKTVKGLRDHILSSSRLGVSRDVGSPARHWGQPWSRELGIDRSLKSEEEATVDGKIARRSRR